MKRAQIRGSPLAFVVCCGVLTGCAIAGVSGTPSTNQGLFGSGRDDFVPDPLPEYGRPPGAEESNVDSVSGELYALVQAQEHYHDLNNTYARGLSALREVVDYNAGDGIRVRIIRATEAGFSATSRQGRFECAVFVGNTSSPRDYAQTEGLVGCNEPRR